MEQTGRLSAWRSAFLAARLRPPVVRGPVLARALARLALIFRSLVKPRFFLRLAAARALTRRPRSHRPQSRARCVAAFRRGPRGADQSRAGRRCGGARRRGGGGRAAPFFLFLPPGLWLLQVPVSCPRRRG